MRENWKSFVEYLSRFATAGWALASGTLMWLVLWATDTQWTENNWPYLPHVGAAIVFLLVAPFRAFHHVRTQRDIAKGAKLERNLKFHDAMELVGGRYGVQSGGFEWPLLKLLQAAVDGDIQIWGKRATRIRPEEEGRGQWSDTMESPYLPIPAEYWRTHGFNWYKGFREHHLAHAFPHDGDGTSYVDLMLNRQQLTDPALKLRLSFKGRLYDRYYAWGEGGSVLGFAIRDFFRVAMKKLGIT